jgi:hypothetical protein
MICLIGLNEQMRFIKMLCQSSRKKTGLLKKSGHYPAKKAISLVGRPFQKPH